MTPFFQPHAAKLEASAIPFAAAAAAGIRSVTAAHVTRQLFGADSEKAAPGDALEIPYRTLDGEPMLADDAAMYARYRIFADAAADGRVTRYMMRAGSGSRPYLPAGLSDALPLSRYIVVTEGELKALSAATAGIATVGIGGVTMWAGVDGKPHADIVALVAAARGAIVLADSDARDNPAVRQHMQALTDALRAACPGAIVAYACCPSAKAKRGPKPAAAAEPKVGLDDWIAASRPDIHAVTRYLDWVFDAEAARQATLSAGGYVPLGYSAGGHHVWSVPRGRVETVSASAITSPGTLMTVAGGLEWCQAAYGKPGRGNALVVDWQQMGGELVARCTAAGAFNPGAVRGLGVWQAPDARDALIVNGSTIWRSDGEPQERITTDFIYPTAGTLGIAHDTPAATPADAADLLAAIATWRWARASDATLMLGWTMYAFLAGAAPWRAHLSLTGARGTGKSFLEALLARILGAAALTIDGDSTEAGIRQRVGQAALALLIDEAEADAAKLGRLLQFLRSASSGASVLRGTQDQAGTEFTLRVAGMVAGICPPLLSAADESRFITLELTGVNEAAAATPHPLVSDPAAAAELGIRLFARMVQSWPRLLRARAIIRPLVGGDPRYSDSVAPVLAAGWVALHDDELDIETATQYVAGIDLANDKARVTEAQDEQDLLHHILTSSITATVDGRGARMTIAELVRLSIDETGGKGPLTRELGAHGLRAAYEDEKPTLLINTRAQGFLSLLRETKWARGRVEESLKRIPGASQKKTTGTVAIGGTPCRALAVPVSLEKVAKPLGYAEIS